MNQSRDAVRRVDPRASTGFWPRAVCLVPLLASLLLFLAVEASAAGGVRLAVAPFVGDEQTPSIAKRLADAIDRRQIERLIAPGEFVAATAFSPTAAEIRRWAYNAAVDTLLLGRVSLLEKTDRPTRIVEAVLRSGHSGVELSRHRVSWHGEADRVRAIEELADSILAGLGSSTTAFAEEGSTDAASLSVGGLPEPALGGSGGGFNANFSESGFSEDAPIEIKAEEAEIINLNGGRRLIFQHNVVVEQANVLLRSDRLEAFYRAGESQPWEMRASGSVSIDQGDRRAECDRAIYLRESNMLTCYGHAKLVQDCDVVRGDLIEFNLTRDRARVEGSASIVVQPEGVRPSDCDRGQS